jgi:hypothetical protein
MNAADSNGPLSTYDLTQVSQTLYTRWLQYRWFTLVIVAGFSLVVSGLLALFAFEEALSGRFWTRGVADMGLVAFFAVFAALFLLVGNSKVRRPATRVELSAVGVQVGYPSGKLILLRWTDPSFRLKIGSMYSHLLKQPLRTSSFAWWPRLFMTEEVANSVLSAARARGMDITEVRDPGSSTGQSTVIKSSRGRTIVPPS